MTQEPKIFPYIAKLLNGEKVQWKPLGEISSMYGGLTGKNKTDFEEGNASYITYKNIFDNIEIDFSKLEKVKISSSEKQNKVKYGDILFTGSSETAEEAGMSSTITINIEEDIYLNSFSFGVRFDEDVELLPEFTKYLFRSYFMRKSISKTASGVTRFNISKERFKKIPIPIPPLSVQQEIVRILDKFTQLEAELEAELDCRKRQYEYYRNALLSFDDLENRGGYNSLINNKIQYKTLGEVGTFIRGNGLQKKDLIESGVPAIHYGQIYTHYGVSTEQTISFVSSETAEKLKKVDYGDVIITNTSENLEDVGKAVAYYVKEQGVTGGHATIFKPSEKIIGKYLVYYTQTIEFSNQKRTYAKGTKVIDVSANDLAKISIPLPPIEEQERIVAILDKFDTLVNSISEGLPKEIQQRRQQYEYYREQLLTF